MDRVSSDILGWNSVTRRTRKLFRSKQMFKLWKCCWYYKVQGLHWRGIIEMSRVCCCLAPKLPFALHWGEDMFDSPDNLVTWWESTGQRWNGEFFSKDSLQKLGYRYQLGHSGARCPRPHPGPKNFVIFDISGPHFISIDYCHCGNQPLSTWHQLLHEKWFPATLSCPQMVFTFDCLETFHELTLQGKTNLYDYYHTLLWRSDNANLSNPIVRFWKFYFVFC